MLRRRWCNLKVRARGPTAACVSKEPSLFPRRLWPVADIPLKYLNLSLKELYAAGRGRFSVRI